MDLRPLGKGRLTSAIVWLGERILSPGSRNREPVTYLHEAQGSLALRILEALLGAPTFERGSFDRPTGMNDNRVLVLVVGLLGVSAIVAFVIIMVFYAGDKSIAFAGLSALIGLLIPNLLVLRQGAVAAHMADVAASNSAEAVSKAAAVGKTIDQVHAIVNGDKSKMEAKIAALEVMIDMERRARASVGEDRRNSPHQAGA